MFLPGETSDFHFVCPFYFIVIIVIIIIIIIIIISIIIIIIIRGNLAVFTATCTANLPVPVHGNGVP